MTARPRAVLFDLDGTLLDSLPAFLAITRHACRELAWPLPGPDYLRQVLTLGRSPIEALLGPVDDEPRLRQQLGAVSMTLWQEVFAREARLFEDTLVVLQRLHAAGHRLGIVTDSNHHVVRHLTATPGCPPMATVVTRDEAPARKPSPSGIALALAHLRLAPHEAVYIGDNPIDIQAARGAGVIAYGITTGASRREDLMPHDPHAVFDSLSDLHAHLTLALHGRLVGGLGEAGRFLAIDWVRDTLETCLQQPFHPGTVNLQVDGVQARRLAALPTDARLRRFELPGRDGFCPATLYATRLHHGPRHMPALLLRPQVAGYPADKLELVCPQPVRASWALNDGALLELHPITLEEPWP